MKKQIRALAIAAVAAAAGGLASGAQAAVIPPISLTQDSPSFVAQGAQQTPNAWVYAGDPEIWQFDLSSFSKPLKVTLSVSDNWPQVPDDYDLSWDGAYLGNTFNHAAADVVSGAASGSTFSFITTAGLHTLAVDYINRFTGLAPDNEGSGTEVGSWYNLHVSVAAVPEPSSYALLLAGLAMVGLTVRSKMRD